MLRNRKIRYFAFIFCFIAAVSVILAFEINVRAGILISCSITAFGILFFVFTKVRYDHIAQMSEQIDLVLHNADHLLIAKEDEGELSVLQSEITKMTKRIREQNNTLKREKEHLAESLADIAHQLRTPLTSANLTLSLLENSSGEERTELLWETKELFSHMDWLLASLLKLSRLDADVVIFQNGQVARI